ncbi:MAG: hypothetical protein HY744_00195 [Deltaproteobacteria bacterium]|nr:hypothetical protein [Deltaproteobacteria bacterium]
MTTGRTLSVLASLLAALALGGPARAQSATSEQKARAEVLFTEAVALMKEKRYQEACLKLAASQLLDPSSGTAFNLARCSQLIGRRATAWAQFQAAESLARQQGRPEHEQAARQAREALEPELSKVVVVVPEQSRVPGLVVSIDAAPLELGGTHGAVPVDPGEHKVQASAPGRVSFEASVTIGAEREIKMVTVPLLDEVPAAPGPAAEAPPALPQPPPGALALPAPWPPPRTPVAPAARAVPLPPAPVPLPAEEPTGSVQRGLGVALGVAGLAGIGIATGFGVDAASKNGSSKDLCSESNLCSPKGAALRDDAFESAMVSTVALVAGSVAVAGGLIVYLTAPSPDEPAAGSARQGTARPPFWVLEARASVAGLSLRGRW